jgi:ribosome modulation factor
MEAEAYYAGYWLALEGGDRDANPYAEVERRRCWDEGWMDAQEERRVSER